MKKKVSRLDTVQLDYWVAVCEGFRMVKVGYCGTESETAEQKELPEWFWKETDHSVGCYWVRDVDMTVYSATDPAGVYETPYEDVYSPSQNWWDGGPIIEREKISLMPGRQGSWLASHRSYPYLVEGKTPLMAAMRAWVCSNVGDYVTYP